MCEREREKGRKRGEKDVQLRRVCARKKRCYHGSQTPSGPGRPCESGFTHLILAYERGWTCLSDDTIDVCGQQLVVAAVLYRVVGHVEWSEWVSGWSRKEFESGVIRQAQVF